MSKLITMGPGGYWLLEVECQGDIVPTPYDYTTCTPEKERNKKTSQGFPFSGGLRDAHRLAVSSHRRQVHKCGKTWVYGGELEQGGCEDFCVTQEAYINCTLHPRNFPAVFLSSSLVYNANHIRTNSRPCSPTYFLA